MGQLIAGFKKQQSRWRLGSEKGFSTASLNGKAGWEFNLETDAKFSDCRNYRYALWRIWDETKPYVMIIGLNPSTADEIKNDPTITRCISFAQSWGYGGVYMVNLFAFRATVPSEMMSATAPIGPENDKWLTDLAKAAGIVVAAWGNDGGYLGRSAAVKAMFSDLHCIKVNKSGEPAHPLYLKGDLEPVPLSI